MFLTLWNHRLIMSVQHVSIDGTKRKEQAFTLFIPERGVRKCCGFSEAVWVFVTGRSVAGCGSQRVKVVFWFR
jgi:hypothetical protein